MKLVAYSDAGFAGLNNRGSQAGYIVFTVGDNNSHVPISWQSHSVRQVGKGTHAAETLAMVDTMEACTFYRK